MWTKEAGVYDYSLKDFGKMEIALLTPLGVKVHSPGITSHGIGLDDPNYEEKLFTGMCAALEVLREIHKERGEDVDGIETPFAKRTLFIQTI